MDHSESSVLVVGEKELFDLGIDDGEGMLEVGF